MSDAPESNFEDHLDETNRAVKNALGELEAVRAYTLKPDELEDFKAVHYGLRNLLPDHFRKRDVSEVYDE